MKHIVKSIAPSCLAKAHDDNISWEEFCKNRHNDYVQCLSIALNDQNQECAYTGLLLKDPHKHIDHYIKQECGRRYWFAWDNLLAAYKCDGMSSIFGADYKDKVVNISNAQTKYNQILNPLTDDIEHYFYYSIDGEILPNPLLPENEHDKAQNTIDIFNLNDDYLKRRREIFINNIKIYQQNRIEIYEYLSNNGFSFILDFFFNNPMV